VCHILVDILLIGARHKSDKDLKVGNGTRGEGGKNSRWYASLGRDTNVRVPSSPSGSSNVHDL